MSTVTLTIFYSYLLTTGLSFIMWHESVRCTWAFGMFWNIISLFKRFKFHYSLNCMIQFVFISFLFLGKVGNIIYRVLEDGWRKRSYVVWKGYFKLSTLNNKTLFLIFSENIRLFSNQKCGGASLFFRYSVLDWDSLITMIIIVCCHLNSGNFVNKWAISILTKIRLLIV